MGFSCPWWTRTIVDSQAEHRLLMGEACIVQKKKFLLSFLGREGGRERKTLFPHYWFLKQGKSGKSSLK